MVCICCRYQCPSVPDLSTLDVIQVLTNNIVQVYRIKQILTSDPDQSVASNSAAKLVQISLLPSVFSTWIYFIFNWLSTRIYCYVYVQIVDREYSVRKMP